MSEEKKEESQGLGKDVGDSGMTVRRRSEPTRDNRGIFLLVGLVALGGGLLALAFSGMKENAVYSKSIDEVVAQKDKFVNRPVRAEGNLVHGSLERRSSPCEFRFRINKNGVEVPVRYPSCTVPDTLRDIPDMDVAVTVEGQLRADQSFEATNVLAKCPSKYDMAERAKRGEKMPAYDLPK